MDPTPTHTPTLGGPQQQGGEDAPRERCAVGLFIKVKGGDPGDHGSLHTPCPERTDNALINNVLVCFWVPKNCTRIRDPSLRGPALRNCVDYRVQ